MHRRGSRRRKGSGRCQVRSDVQEPQPRLLSLVFEGKACSLSGFFCCLHDKGSVFLPVRKKQEPEALVICLADCLMDGGGQFPETAGEGGQEQIPDICLVRLKGRGRDLHPWYGFQRVHSGFRKICDQADRGKRGTGCLESQK